MQRLRSTAVQVPEVRWDVVANLRARIEAGLYRIDDRRLVDRLIQDLFND